jgi:hypothetical protein
MLWTDSVIGRALAREDWPEITERIAKRFGVELTEDYVSRMMHGPLREMENGVAPWASYSDCSWFCWIKRRVRDQLPAGNGLPSEIYCSCELNIGLLFCEETAEQKERLKNDPGEKEERVAAPARSRITKSPLEKLYPVDRTAMQVAMWWLGVRKEY